MKQGEQCSPFWQVNMCKPFSMYYSTNKLVVLFDCENDRVKCTIYRKGTVNSDNWRILQTHTIRRPGMLKLDKRTQWACMRQVLKVMRHRITKALELQLNQK